MQKIELLAPAGNPEKLNTAFYFGADAVYLGGKAFGLRAQADNFGEEELRRAVETAHRRGKKIYVTVNVFARDSDFGPLSEWLAFLVGCGADGVIVSDLGVLSLCRKRYPSLPVHVSTQANTTNRYAAAFYAELGVERIVLARELTLDEIRGIRDALDPVVSLECFVHGAMCVSYSGRCLLSEALTGRSANLGNCSQPCRLPYTLIDPEGRRLGIEEDERGSYLLNSKDLCAIKVLDRMIDAGVESFKIEGRMKTSYYVATVVNAYRRALDALARGETVPTDLEDELDRVSHRTYWTGFGYGETETIADRTAYSARESRVLAVVLAVSDGIATVEMRNRFRSGDRLEIVSPYGAPNRSFVVGRMTDEEGREVADAKYVCQRLRFAVSEELHAGDFLRSERKDG